MRCTHITELNLTKNYKVGLPKAESFGKGWGNIFLNKYEHITYGNQI